MKIRLFVLTASLAVLIAATTPVAEALQEQRDQPGQPEGLQQDQPEPPQQQRGQARAFIFVEGSLPWIPSANTIATKLPLSLQMTPFNVGIVTQALAEEQYAVTVSDALVNVSNVSLQPGNGVHDFFFIRGFDSLSSSLVLTDGAPEPEATFYELYNVETVEVLKGPSGFLYGSNPLAGTVNLVRKQPSPETHGSVRGSFGRYDWIEGAADINFASADRDFLLRLNTLARDRSGYRDRIEGRSFAINPAATWNIDDSASLNVNFEYVSAEYVPDSGLPLLFGDVPDVPRTNNYQTGLDTSDQTVYRFQTDYQNRINDAVTVRNKLYYRGLDWLSDGTLFNGVFPEFDPFFLPTGNFVVSRSLVLLDDRQDLVGNQIEAILDVETGGIRHNLLLGFEVARHTDRFSLDVGFLPDVDLFNPGEPFTGTPFPIPGQSQAGDARSFVAAPYVIDQIALHDRFQVLAGVRVDAIDFDDELRGVSRSDTNASPMLGLVFVADDATSIYGNYSRSFAPPAARVQTGEVLPEEGEQAEIGVKRELFDGRARASFAVYQLERENIGIPDNNGITRQIGTQRSRGFEAELVAEPRDDVRFVGSYAFNDAELTEFSEIVISFDPLGNVIFQPVDRSGNDPAFAPRHVFNAWVSKDFGRALVIGGGARYVSDQFIAEDNVFTIDDVLTFDALVSYAIGDVRLDLNVRNLTDREYNRRGFGDNSVIPADPVTVFFGASYRR